MTSLELEGPAGSIHVDDGGSGGTAIVFVPSFGGNTTHWAAQLDHFRTSRRCVAVDLRGHGRSELAGGLDSTASIEAIAGDVEATIEGLGLGRVVLVGHGMGAAVALAYAGRHPDRVAGLILVVPPGSMSADQADQIVASMEADYEGMTERTTARLLDGARPETETRIRRDGSMPRDKALRFIRATQSFDPEPPLRAYSGPKLAITGDTETPNDLHNLVGDLPRKVVSGTSHWLPMDDPEAFNRLVDEFLATIDESGRPR